MEGKNINLMPKESRGSEKDTTSKIKVDDFQPHLVIPKKQVIIKKEEVLPEKPQIGGTKKEEVLPEKPFVLPEVEGIKFHEPKPSLRAKLVGRDLQGVDLIPAAAKIRNWQQINRLFLLAFISSLGIILVFYIGLFIFERSLDIEEQTTSTEISQIEDNLLSFVGLNEDIKELGEQIIVVYNALNKHIYWTNFFVFLEQYTLASVHYNGFSAGSGGTLILNAVGDNFNAVAKQLKILEQSENFLTEVSISSATLSEEGVEFSITLNLDPNLFYYQEN